MKVIDTILVNFQIDRDNPDNSFLLISRKEGNINKPKIINGFEGQKAIDIFDQLTTYDEKTIGY